MLKNRFVFRAISVLLIVSCLIIFIPTSTVFAWGAADRWPGKAQTHQVILKEAYKLLEADPAWKDSNFPTRDEILQYEGMKWEFNITFDLIGQNEYAILGVGPDDETRTPCSAHFYNPETGKGGGPEWAKTYYSALLNAMYGSTSSNISAAQGAAWSSHFVSDLWVPYHVVGAPGNEIQDMDRANNYFLDEKQTGPAFLYGAAGEQTLVPAAWGKDGNFAKNIRRFVKWVNEAGPNAKRDWFEAWYLNGSWWADLQSLTSSHVNWENAAHQTYLKNPYGADRATDTPGWLNSLPTWGNPLGDQIAQSREFAIKAAKMERANLKSSWQNPPASVYNSIDSTYTLWRSSISALKPSFKITPDGSNQYTVRGKVLNVAAESANQLEARLTVTGGTLKETKNPVLIQLPAGKTWDVSWSLTSDKIENCKLKMEVIGQYITTPDLQYAVAKTVEPMTVNITPDEVDRGEKIKLTVQVNPPQKTDLELMEAWGMFEEDVKGPFSTGADGKFVKEFTIDKEAYTGKHEIDVRAPKLKLSGWDTFRIGKLPPFEVNKSDAAEFSLGVRPFWKNSLTGKAPSWPFDRSLSSGRGWTKGVWSGSTFVMTWDEKEEARGAFSPANTKKGSLKITFDASFTKIMSFTLTNQNQVLSPNIEPVAEEITLTGTTLVPPVIVDRDIDWASWLTEGDSIQQNYNINIKSKRTYRNGSFDTLEGWDCNPVGAGAILRFQFRLPGSTRN